MALSDAENPLVLDLDGVRPPANPKPPWEHQTTTWNDLDRHFSREKNKAGFIVVPTGGGKTHIAAHWLMLKYLRQGWRILWLAHRRGLLVQARTAFDEMRYIAADKMKTLGRIIISQGDSRWSEIDDSINLVFSTIQSATQKNNRHRVENLRKQSPNGLFVVFDEAHHACAPTYIPLLRDLKKSACPLLGLTATPMRMDERDRNRLFELFDGNIITRISKQELIHRGILANPHAEEITTKVTLEGDFEMEGKDLVNQFGELAEYVLDRLANSATRNKLIVKQYVDNQKRYGKTIVFAINILHAKTLKLEFERKGVRADVVYYKYPNPEAVERYKDKKCNNPEVLINVMMFTEGFDAPCTKTVFITCPTNSEVKVQQMCGRAMRGVSAKGNKTAYLVSFVDTWKTFSPVEPNIILAADDASPDELEAAARGKPKTIPIEEAIILAAYNLLRSRLQGEILASYRYIPEAWYSWANDAEEGPDKHHVLVFAHQVDAFIEMEKYVTSHSKEFDSDSLSQSVCAKLVSQFFHDCPDPTPAWNDIGKLAVAWAVKKEVDRYTLKEKEVFNPRIIAADTMHLNDTQLHERLVSLMAANRLCKEAYYGDVLRFMEDVHDKKRELIGVLAPLVDVPLIFAKMKLKPLSPWPNGKAGWNLNKIQQDVLNNSHHFPKGTPDISSIEFTREPRAYCWAYYSLDQNSITIDCKLNSPDVPLMILEFLAYHELLHADMGIAIGHKGNFKPRERKFIPTAKAKKDALEKHIRNDNNQNWAGICDQYLDTWGRRFEGKGGKVD